MQRLTYTNPEQVVVADQAAQVPGVLAAAEQARAGGRHVVGFVCYESAGAFDDAFRTHPAGALPAAWFAVFTGPDQPHPPTAPVAADATTGYRVAGWIPDTDESRYSAAIDEIRAAIGEGVTYQTNYTVRMHSPFTGDPSVLYDDLRHAQRAGYCAYLDTGRFVIVSASPELFFDWRDGMLTTRPMKGTARRGRFTAEDQTRRAELLASTKNRAENLMMVDLLRNDLHRVCEPGTVKVTDLFATEAYPTVWQLTSTVTGLTRPGVGLVEVFTALFPCGSITGAPKASTMRVITALETSPRGVYCGAIGLLTPTRTTFNVAIRSVVLDRDTGIAEYGVGGGITWDSTAEDEYDEVLAKAAVLGTRRPAFGLIETISLRDGQYTLLPEHLTRLADSAAYFGIPVVLSQILDALDTASAEAGAGSWRVRLVVDEQGLPQVQVAALAGAPVDTGGPPPPGSRPPLRGALAGDPVDERSIWLFHKTTNRRVYDAQRAAHPAADDVLLVNRAGELTEWTVGNLVVELDGALVTPPVRCGLLPGTLRARLFADGVISARVLTPEDLHRVSGIWLINGVRGWVPMTLDVTDNVTSTVV